MDSTINCDFRGAVTYQKHQIYSKINIDSSKIYEIMDKMKMQRTANLRNFLSIFWCVNVIKIKGRSHSGRFGHTKFSAPPEFTYRGTKPSTRTCFRALQTDTGASVSRRKHYILPMRDARHGSRGLRRRLVDVVPGVLCELESVVTTFRESWELFRGKHRVWPFYFTGTRPWIFSKGLRTYKSHTTTGGGDT